MNLKTHLANLKPLQCSQPAPNAANAATLLSQGQKLTCLQREELDKSWIKRSALTEREEQGRALEAKRRQVVRVH